jgi:small GTP-binding protein
MSTKKVSKVGIVGEGNVGKTNLVRGDVDRVLVQNTIPIIGVDLSTKIIPQGGYEKLLQIWDLGGQPHMRFVAQVFFRGASRMMTVFDVKRKQSLVELDGWIQPVYQETGRVPLVIAGTKMISEPLRIKMERVSRESKEQNSPSSTVRPISKHPQSVALALRKRSPRSRAD